MSKDLHFKKAVSASLNDLTAEDLKPIALAVWHEDYTPNISDLSLEEKRKAGYLLDRLMRFSCVADWRKRELVKLVKQLRDATVEYFTDKPLSEEKLAAKWNLSEDVAEALQELLPYQTRHYAHN